MGDGIHAAETNAPQNARNLTIRYNSDVNTGRAGGVLEGKGCSPRNQRR
jgi:hypothetical protein